MNVKIGIIGDIHGQFDHTDVDQLNRSEYDLLLFVGDLCRLVRPAEIRSVAKRISQIEKPALLVPGNHDVPNAFLFITELIGLPRIACIFSKGHPRFHYRLQEWLDPVPLAGYSLHSFHFGRHWLDLIAGRPYSMGGSRLSYQTVLSSQYGIRTLEESTAMLIRKVEQSSSERLLFIAHNGPLGLGDQPEDIWGVDFDPRCGDFGDRDLTAAIDHAQQVGKKVLAIIAGHMHLETKSGEERPWKISRDGILYINPARVPRHRDEDGSLKRHHIYLKIGESATSAREIWW